MSQIPTDPAVDLEAAVRELVRESKQTNATIANLNARMRKRTVLIILGFVITTLALTLAVNAAYQVSLNNAKAIRQNNRLYCPIILGLAPTPGDAPPPGTPKQQERSLRIRDTFARLAADPDFGCR